MKPKGYLHIPLWWPSLCGNWRDWLPSKGNALFTLLVVGGLFWAGSVGAVPLLQTAASSTNTVAYQGRLADATGNPVTATTPMVFRLYNAATGGVPLWEENWVGPNSVNVSDGLFNVMLGSLTQIPQSVVTGNSNLWLGITVNADNEMQPRVQLGTVPFAVQALTVPDGSITAAKLAPSISFVPPDGSITTAKIADGAVTAAKLAPSISLTPPDASITTAKLADGAVTSRKVQLQVGSAIGTDPGLVAVTTTGVELAGTSRTITIDVPSTVIVTAIFDFVASNGSSAAGNVMMDGNRLWPVAVVTAYGSSSVRATASTQVHINLEPGTHRLSLWTWLDSGTSGSIYPGQTTYSYFVVAR